MAEADLEVVRRIYQGFAERRFPGEWFAEEVEWKSHPDMPDADTYRGLREVRRFFADWVAGWAEVRNEVEQLLDAGDRIVALIHGSFRLTEGATPLERDYAHVWTVRDGKVRRVEAVEREDALRIAREAD
jgi:ketosteroid isomerase-like protein